MKLGLSKENLSALTLAAMLHDVGKTRISDNIVEKPGKKNEAEYEDMKRHAIYGYELLKISLESTIDCINSPPAP